MKWAAVVVVSCLVVAAPRSADAFCGFYVAGSGKPMFNDATQVVLMRDGARTVMSMRNNYKGPPEAFAMVIPVPVVLQEENVKTLTQDVFDRVEALGAPRLVEYWEQDPCGEEDMPGEGEEESGGTGTAMSLDEGKMGRRDLGVTVEAQFVVGEYEIVILSAKESTGLDTWLRQENYKIPAGAEPLLRPYVEGGLKFFVAKVDPTKVKFVEGRAELSPLRFHFDAEQFVLPIRLGLANSAGMQDLIINILAPNDQRYEVHNYSNVTIPTNITVKNGVRDRFAEFYVSLFDATIAKTKNAVVTEYAWQASGCDPCPGDMQGLPERDISALGGDVVTDRRSMTLTRLHARYDRTISDDLFFRTAPPLQGGREIKGKDGKLEYGAVTSDMNNFQARYVIRHAWTGPIACADPVRGRWGGPVSRDEAAQPIKPALDTAFATRTLELASAVVFGVPELGVAASKGPLTNRAATAGGTSGKSGCGCGATSSAPTVALVLLALLVPLRRRRASA